MGLNMEERGARGMIDRDDLVDVALLAVVGAKRRFDPDRGTSFKTFAMTRARGAMIDEMRAADHVPRLERARARKEGRELPMVLSLQQAPVDLVPRDFPDPIKATPAERAAASDLWRDIWRVLPSQQAFIVEKYFRHDKTLKEISVEIDMSESRTCQLVAAAIDRLRLRWKTLDPGMVR